MAAKNVKGSSFSKSMTKAESTAYNTKNKLRTAKEALTKKSKEIKSLESAIKRKNKT